MTFIPCTADCIYQKDGECFLDRAVSCGQPNSDICAYYIRKTYGEKTKEINRLYPNAQ